MAQRMSDGWVDCTIPPYAEPIDIAEAKQVLRVFQNDDDALILNAITQARDAVEARTGRRLVAATYVLRLIDFPRGSATFGADHAHGMGSTVISSAATEPDTWWDGNIIKVPGSPLCAVSSVVYVAADGTSTTLSTSNYAVSGAGFDRPGRIAPTYGNAWPATRYQPDAVTVTFTSGYLCPFTATASSATLTLKGRSFTTGDRVRLTKSGLNGGELPGGLSVNTDYFVVSATSTTCGLSLTSGGSAITVTSVGGGTNYIGLLPGNIRQQLYAELCRAWWPSDNTDMEERALASSALMGWTGEMY